MDISEDVRRVRLLAELMEEHGLTEIRIREGAKLISLRKGPLGPAAAVPAAAAVQPAAAAPAPPPLPRENLIPIVSPMVGTFYASPEPEAHPFVTVGSEIDPNTTVCVIEAMKVFNEIKAEVSGIVERVLVHNDQPVEFGQPLMLVRPI